MFFWKDGVQFKAAIPAIQIDSGRIVAARDGAGGLQVVVVTGEEEKLVLARTLRLSAEQFRKVEQTAKEFMGGCQTRIAGGSRQIGGRRGLVHAH